MSSEPAARRGNFHRGGFSIIACWLAFLTGCGSQPDDGLKKYPVTGLVEVDGQPADGVVVRFFRDGKPGRTNADTPLGVTKSDGRFELSTNGDGDGAVAGAYRVTFTWKTGNSPAAEDRLGGRYTKLERSDVTVTVRPEANELEPFRLDSTDAAEKEPVRQRRRSRPNPNAPAAQQSR